MMVAWWRRLVYSLLSMVLGAGLCGAVIAAKEFLDNAHGRISAMGLLTAVVYFDTWVVLLSVPGWLLATPIVLLVRNIRGWRFWMYLTLGACFGPALILAVAFYSAVRGLSLEGFPGHSMSVVYMAGAVSTLTTAFYLVMLRSARNRSLERAGVTTF
jgi:hypothetical protein